MISIELAGGLGNQLFQICNGLALSFRYNTELFFPNYQENVNIIKYQHSPNAEEYLTTIYKNLNLKFDKINDNHIHDQIQFNYYDVDYIQNTYYKGYFQSEKFFIDEEKKIKDIFYNELIKKYKNDENYACIHIRRGDYIHQQHNHPVLTKSYYDSAIRKIDYDKLFIISNDLDWCKKYLNYPDSEYINDKDYECLYRMSQCKSHIIANSSFSWWGAKFAEWYGNPEKILAPNVWFGLALNHLNTKDVVPERWGRISC